MKVGWRRKIGVREFLREGLWAKAHYILMEKINKNHSDCLGGHWGQNP